MSSVEIEKVFAEWADKAWAAAKGDWKKAQVAFLTVREASLPNLAPVKRVAIEDEVWRFFANQQINKVIQRLRAQARVAPSLATPPATTPGKSKRTAVADAASADAVADLFLDTFYLTTGGVALRSATFDAVSKEAQMRSRKATTAGRDAQMLFAIIDKMEAEGCSSGDERTVGAVVQDDFVEKLREVTYA